MTIKRALEIPGGHGIYLSAVVDWDLDAKDWRWTAQIGRTGLPARYGWGSTLSDAIIEAAKALEGQTI